MNAFNYAESVNFITTKGYVMYRGRNDFQGMYK